jgi:hypothetical protein
MLRINSFLNVLQAITLVALVQNVLGVNFLLRIAFQSRQAL